MPKRLATTELNHDNWDKEDDVDDEELQVGTPVAKELDLEKRKIIVAKRRNIASSPRIASTNGGDRESGIFASFTGFVQVPRQEANGSLQNGNNQSKSQRFEVADRVIFVDIDKDSALLSNREVGDSRASDKGSAGKTSDNQIVNGRGFANTANDSSSYNKNLSISRPSEHRQFCKHLKALNEGVFQWIEKHIRVNPYIDLSPVFTDYFKHLKSLEQRFNRHETTQDLKQNGKFESVEPSSSVKLSIVESSKAQTNGERKIAFMPNIGAQPSEGLSLDNADMPQNTSSAKPLAFNFASTTSSADICKDSGSNASFSFGFPSVSQGRSGTDNHNVNSFSFGLSRIENKDDKEPSGGLFSCLNNANTTEKSGSGREHEQADDDQYYEPPKPELVSVEEKDAFYSVKSKLFYKSDNKFIEKGIGTLHLKELESGKRQLLIRTDTALGNILLNVCLSDATPCSRTGKNNVTLVCIPNPPLNAPKVSEAGDDKSNKDDELREAASDLQADPTSFLIRVKTSEEADQLFEHMKPKD